jgi:prepilin signal peptidase PulO-like enzyme (type II secretory pathway)
VTFGIAFLLASRDRIRTKAREVGITLNPRPLRVSVIKALTIILPFAIVAEAPFLIAPAFTSFSFMAIEARIAFLGLIVLLPTLAVLALIDLISRRLSSLFEAG